MKAVILSSALLLLFGVTSAAQKFTQTDYIDTYANISMKEMRRSGIPASITLAQGILESGSGNSRLAREANNHFGIKCHSSWSGKKTYEDDDEKQECFRVYKNAQESFIDHSNFLKRQERYNFLFKLKKTDYKSWARGLKKAGYATHPKYSSLLIQLIEKHKLWKYDGRAATATMAADENVMEFNRIDMVMLEPDATLKDIAAEYQISYRRLLKYNDLHPGQSLAQGQKVYLQPKRRKASSKFHIVVLGETMHSISQEHGIQLKMLYIRNLMQFNTEPAVGVRLYLRGKAKRPAQAKGRSGKTEAKYYIVQKGDTLYSIARHFDITVTQLKKMNPGLTKDIKSGNPLVVGY